MEKDKPLLLIVAGPNGAGKTTFIDTYLPEYTSVREFVNADLIAKGISPFAPEGASVEAGRFLLRRVHQLLDDRISFALETTLSGRGHVELFREAKNLGYDIQLYYIYLDSVELSLSRIEERVRKGGHNVPRADVIRRYGRSLENFFQLYLPFANEWQIFENSGKECRPVAAWVGDELDVADSSLYLEILSKHGHLPTSVS